MHLALFALTKFLLLVLFLSNFHHSIGFSILSHYIHYIPTRKTTRTTTTRTTTTTTSTKMTITPYSPLHPSEFPHPPPPPSSPWSSSFYSRSLALYNNLQSNPLHKRAVSQIINALRLYAPEGVIVSFNGGKDATVVAALTCAGFAGYYEEVGDIGPPPRGIFFDDDLDFEQVKYFVKEVSLSRKLSF